MGAGSSKHEDRSDHLWKSSGPPSLSLGVLDSIQANPETDASRAKQTERHIQSRVAEELKKLTKREDETLSNARAKIAADADVDADSAGPDRFAVSKEIDGLRQKLDQRKQMRTLPESVDKARSEVVRCLRDNDRRPLDCWKEVEAFKAEVKKMEDNWVEKVVSS